MEGQVTYLGNMLTSDICDDDDDVRKKKCELISSVNILNVQYRVID